MDLAAVPNFFVVTSCLRQDLLKKYSNYRDTVHLRIYGKLRTQRQDGLQ